MRFRGIFALLLPLLLLEFLFAGTTGKISGRVVDKQNGEPLIGVNVLVKDTQLGAATDLDGYYTILNVPPGSYTLQALYIGYQQTEISEVLVSIDLTTRIDIELSETTLEVTEVITITAERPVVKRDLTATTAVVGGDEIAALPVTEVSEVLELQAGYVDGHMRGGRKGEVAYWIDGIPVTDAYDGGTVVEVSKDMVQELQVVSGAFNAEYGNAMSGIVNIATKEGSNEFGGQVNTYIGDYLSSHNDIFWNIDDFDPVAIYNFDGSIHGAIQDDKFFYYLNARHIYFDGWHQGKQMFNPEAYGIFPQNFGFNLPGDPEYYVLGSDATMDSIINAEILTRFISPPLNPNDPAQKAIIDSMYNVMRSAHPNPLGNGEYVSMNWSQKDYLQGKFIYKFSDVFKLMSSTIYDQVDYRDYDRAYALNPKGDVSRHRLGFTQLFKISHVLSTSTFYDLGLTYFNKKYEEYVYEDPNDPRHIHPAAYTRYDGFSFNTGGTNLHRFERETQTYLAKFDLTSQFTRTNEIKLGFEFKQHILSYEDIDLQPPPDKTDYMNVFYESPYISPVVADESTVFTARYENKPMEASFYIQDKIEFDDFILNLGVRFDYFDADGRILSDPTDPKIASPARPENKFHDQNGNGWHDSEDVNRNGILDPNEDVNGNGDLDYYEPFVTLAERETYWYKKADPKFQFSPRIGAAFPISERGKIYFSYGHFFQRPKFEYLYTNPDYDFEIGETTIVGNADLKPEKTTSGEIGIQQQVSDDLSIDATLYFRDIRDLTGTRADKISVYGGASDDYLIYKNSDFGLTKGFILALNKRLSGGMSARIDYTYQVAEGTASEPNDAQKASDSNTEPEVQLIPLGWDQRHTINASFSYAAETWGFSVLSQYGSGLPYTPQLGRDVSVILTNSGIKPQSFNMDLKAYKDFYIDNYRLTAFLRIFNLFDTLNEVNVYDDTGRAGESEQIDTAKNNNPYRYDSYNTIDEWFTNATHYSEPRRIELGLTINF